MTVTMGAVMARLGTALGTIDGLRVFPFPPLSAQPPFAFVDMPEIIVYDQTYGRGSDRMTVNIVVGVAVQVDRSAQDAMSAYADGASVKAAVENISEFSCRVQSVAFGSIVLAGATYWGATFEVDVSA